MVEGLQRQSDDVLFQYGRGPGLRSAADRRSLEKKGLLALIAGEPGRTLELNPRFGQPAGPEQKIPPGRRQGGIVTQRCSLRNLVDELQTDLWAEGHAVSHSSIQIDHRRWHDLA